MSSAGEPPSPGSDFDGRVVIVTGGASGMGRATATLLAERGGQVVIADVNDEAAARVVDSIGEQASYQRTDLRELEQIDSLVAQTRQRFGKIDGLANVAALTTALFRGEGATDLLDFLDTTPDVWQRFDDVNHRAVFFLTQRVARTMIASGTRGSIVHVASSSAFRPVLGVSAYAGTKGAVIALTRPMARELKPHGIRVNSVSPGHTLSETVLNITQGQDISALEQRLGGARFMKPEELGEAIVFMLSDASRGMTGAVLHVNNGNYMPH